MSLQYTALSRMLRYYITSSVLFSVLLRTGLCDDKFTGPGLWHVDVVKKCPEDSAMPIKLDCERHKINRSHDGFDIKIKLDEILDETYALRADICKKVDGGCKPCQVIAEDSMAKFVMKYAENNVKQIMGMASIDPPEFPINPGDYSVKGFLMDYDELPEDGPYGFYECKAFILKDGVEKACLEMHVDFQEKDE